VRERVIVAMSGGVDSSVAAARLVDQGFEVIGITLHLWDPPPGARRGRCCAPEDVHDARRVASRLGIAHHTLDRRTAFREAIVGPFVADYLRGWTPSPCVRCNREVKFPVLLRVAHLAGARWVATGHYARVARDAAGRPRLARAARERKDQSYYLFDLGEAWLSRLLFPLGEDDKPAVRAEALRRGLAGAHKGESQDLCFVPDGDYARFVEEVAASEIRPGEVVDESGRSLGRHGGVHRFTLGQRKRLGVAGRARLYVTAIEPEAARVVLGGSESLLASELRVARPRVAQGVDLPVRALVRVRYRDGGQWGLVSRDGTGLRIELESPARAPALGQAAVAYEGDLVVAGGIITEVRRGPVALRAS
jgi:tRNA-specific 2-thiouridylase